MISIIIAFRPTTIERTENLNRCIDQFKKLNTSNEIIIKQDTINDGDFNKSKLLNQGIKESKYEYLLFIDADLLLSDLAVINSLPDLLNRFDIVRPFKDLYDLPEGIIDLNTELCTVRPALPIFGGATGIRKQTIINMAGFPEEMIGYGVEDNYQDLIASRGVLTSTTIDLPAFHQYHKPAKVNDFNFNNNLNIYKKVAEMEDYEFYSFMKTRQKEFLKYLGNRI